MTVGDPQSSGASKFCLLTPHTTWASHCSVNQAIYERHRIDIFTLPTSTCWTWLRGFWEL